MAALTADARLRLLIALASPGAAKQIADAVDASNGDKGTNNTWTGTNTFQAQSSFKRIDAKQNTTHVPGDYALSRAKWEMTSEWPASRVSR